MKIKSGVGELHGVYGLKNIEMIEKVGSRLLRYARRLEDDSMLRSSNVPLALSKGVDLGFGILALKFDFKFDLDSCSRFVFEGAVVGVFCACFCVRIMCTRSICEIGWIAFFFW